MKSRHDDRIPKNITNLVICKGGDSGKIGESAWSYEHEVAGMAEEGREVTGINAQLKSNHFYMGNEEP
ncbi:hypothetical protein NPX13_g4973 [Xylaria arbuscula]|uniref:Uncharacterized protein n=1 Tax=Xylaria arbuscula TaxID=114810 RepID=A0A9W8NEI3_9PEZI|nr:hypothetical protein NPX13_g4973 [Xylaria arbuscula]